MESAAGAIERGEGTLEGPGAEEHALIDGEAAEGRGRREPDQPDREHALAPAVVGDPATEEQQSTEGQGVGRDHPLTVRGGDVEARAGPTGGRS